MSLHGPLFEYMFKCEAQVHTVKYIDIWTVTQFFILSNAKEKGYSSIAMKTT